MPSLENLETFRSLFRSIGHEAEDLKARGVPFDDLPLPDGKSAQQPGNTPVAAKTEDAGGENNVDIADQLKALDAVPDFDFDSLFDDADKTSSGSAGVGETPSAAEDAPDDAFNFDDLFNADDASTDTPLNFDDLFDGDAEPSTADATPKDETTDSSADLTAPTPLDDLFDGNAEPSAADTTPKDKTTDSSVDLAVPPPLDDLFDGNAEPSAADATPKDETTDSSADLAVPPPLDDLFDLNDVAPKDEPADSSANLVEPPPLDPLPDMASLDDLDLDNDDNANLPPLANNDSTILDDFDLDDLPDFNSNAEPLPLDDDDFSPLADGGGADGFNADDISDFDDNAESLLDDGAELPPPADNDGAVLNEIPSLDDIPFDDFNLDDLPDFNETAGPPPSLDDHLPPLNPDDIFVEDTPFDKDDLSSLPPLEETKSNDTFPPFDEPPPSDGAAQYDDASATTVAAAPFDDEDMNDLAPPEPLDAEPSLDEFDSDDDFMNTVADSGLPAPEPVEEIQLTEKDYKHLTNALASYPLNLRIACEELIAEQAVAPDMMSTLIKMLVKEAPAKDVAELAGKIQGRIISIPKGFEKRTGAELEAEKHTFKYIFIHKVLPIVGVALFAMLVVLSLIYLSYRFIHIPLLAESIYKEGYELIGNGKYPEANDKFNEALSLRRDKKWFYRYAEAFAEKRQYLFAEEKYEGLLKYFPKEKQGALDYAKLETDLQNYEKADSILRRYILDYAVNDPEGLLALGDNALDWGAVDPSKYENAREAFARYIEAHGQSDPVLERMLKYFIRTDNLKEVLSLQLYFTNPLTANKRVISAETFTEMSGYLLNKQFAETEGVPDEYVAEITGVRDLLIQAIEKGPAIPEAYYNIARYYAYFNNAREERASLERAVSLFDAEGETTPVRLKTRLDVERLYAEALIRDKEFFAAEGHLLKGISLYEDAVSRKFITSDPQSVRLYAAMGDLDYFTKDGDMDMALQYYRRAEQNGWAPPEMRYRMGAAHYLQEQWAEAQDYFTAVADEIPYNRRLLNALGNVSYMRGNYFAAEAYYSRLLDMLYKDKERFPVLVPQTRPDHSILAERIMVAENNMGVTLESLTERNGNPDYKRRALEYYINSSRAWDGMTRDPVSRVRAGMTDVAAIGTNFAYLNSENAFNPEDDYDPQIYVEIDKDVLEPSAWEELSPQNIRFSKPLR